MDFDFSPVEDLSKVPEDVRNLYDTKPDAEGKYTLNPSFQRPAEIIAGLAKSLKAERKVKATDLSPLAEYGTDPVTIAESFKNAIEAASANKNLDVTKAVEAAKQAMTTANQKEIEKHAARSQALQTQLYGLMVENEATSAVAELKGLPELLMPFIKAQVKVAEENGQFKVQVIDGAGEVRYGATGSPMTIKELVNEMKGNEKYGRLFESEVQQNRGGGGFQPGGGRQPNQQQRPRAELSANDKIAAGLKARQGRR